jgi:sulfur carrier protein
MQVKMNGKIEQISDTHLLGLLKSKNIEPQMVSVELNGTLINRASLADIPVKEGDQIEFLYFMGGGCHGPASKRPRWGAENSSVRTLI